MERDSSPATVSPASDDEGAATVWLGAVGIPIFVVAVAIIIGTGNWISGYSEARDLADSAARAGAQELDLDASRSAGDAWVLDPGAAVATARSFVAGTGRPATSTAAVIGDDQIEVTVTLAVNGWGLIPATTISVTQTATAADGVLTPR